jgi:hypothetical protein
MRPLCIIAFGLALGAAAISREFSTSAADAAAIQAYTAPVSGPAVDPVNYQDLRWRSVGPMRGGRVTAIAGVRSQPCTFYMGATGGGVWKTDTCGGTWTPIGDGQIDTGSIGSIDVRVEPVDRVGWHRQCGDSQQRDHRPRRLQVD